jgi:hypothetical protein
MKKYLIAASALAIGLSMASGAMADQSADDNDNNFGSLVGNSSNAGDDDNDIDIGSGNSLSDEDVTNNNLFSNNDGNGDNRDNVDVDVDVGIEVDVDNSINESVVAEQDLIASTTNVRVTFDDAQALITLADGSQDFNTGEISQSDDAFRGFTGIATIAMDTSLGSNNQAATQVAAGADIIFE